MKLLFCGTPDFAATILAALCDAFPDAEYLVLTAPPRKAGRGMSLLSSAVAQLAQSRGLPLQMPETLKNDAFSAELKAFSPDIAIVAAYGKLLPPYFLSAPRYGCLNVHASLLPALRGADPIRRAIFDGYEKTGVTLMQMDKGLDTGAMLLSRECVIESTDNTETLTQKLADLGALLAVEGVRAAFSDSLHPIPQNDALATYVSKLRHEDERIDWNLPCTAIANAVRALSPSPCAYTKTPSGALLKLVEVRAKPGDDTEKPGLVRVTKQSATVDCGKGTLELLRVKPESKGVMDARALICGRKLSNGDLLS